MRALVVMGSILLVGAACSNSGGGSGNSGPIAPIAPDYGPRFLRGADREHWTLEAITDARDVATADIDGDGNIDFLIGREPPSATVVWGPVADGRPPSSAIGIDVPANAVAVVDADGDGDLDLVLSQLPDAPLAVWLQTAPRHFEPRAIAPPPLPGLTLAIVAVDVDGDGHKDLVCARDDGTLLLRGDGNGGFTAAPSLLPFDTRTFAKVAAGRLFGGALPDLVFAGTAGLAILRNDGQGRFDDVTAAAIGNPTWAAPVDVAIADVDADGDADLVVRARDQLVWFAGNGNGTLAPAVVVAAPGHGAMRLALDDRDLDLDVAVGSNDGVVLLHFDATVAGFVDVSASVLPALPGVGSSVDVVAWQDCDGDGRADLLVRGAALQPLWHLASGRYHFDPRLDYPRFPWPNRGYGSVVSGDFDGDGDPDLAATWSGTTGVSSQFLRNDGAARFTASPEIAVGWYPLAAADVDADGKLDLVAANGWCRGDGNGGFAARTGWPNGVAGAPTQGDFDGDGRREILLLQHGASASVVRLVPAAGGPVLDIPPGLAVGSDAASLLAVDVDGDGIDDVVVVHAGSQTRLFLGTATGAFTDRTGQLPRDLDATVAVAAGDWDGDGHQDLIVARQPGTTPQHLGRIYRNDGHGGFVLGADLVSAEPPGMRVDGVAAADIDADGRAEALFQVQISTGFPGVARTEVFEALADGSVRQISAALAGVEGLAPIAGGYPLQFFDADGDGDVDVLGQELRLNGERDVTFVTRARAGAQVKVRIVDRGFTPNEHATVLLGTATTQVPLPGIGLLLVDPTVATSVAVDVAAGQGIVEASFEVPLLPLSAPAPIHAQALLLDSAGALRAVTSRARASLLPR